MRTLPDDVDGSITKMTAYLIERTIVLTESPSNEKEEKANFESIRDIVFSFISPLMFFEDM